MITVYSQDLDHVIDGIFLTAATNYAFGVTDLFPLVGKLDIQRKLQTPKFYERLERDLLKGCIMPNLTLAFVVDRGSMNAPNWQAYINREISNAFVLDGIQRLNTLARAAEQNKGLDLSRPMFLNIIICPSIDNLLYRMITLNNGQKPMSARHQIEILAANLLDFRNLPIAVHSERDNVRAPNRGFHKADIIKAYIAFLSGLDNIENQKIIEDKMDELIAEKVLDSDITLAHPEFSSVLELIRKFGSNDYVSTWIRVANNLVGFSVGIKSSFQFIDRTPLLILEESLKVFEEAFSSIDVSKIRLGQVRRKLVHHFIANYQQLQNHTVNELLLVMMELL